MVFQVFDIGIARDKPKQFIDDGFQVYLLGGEQGETLAQVEPHLVAEHAFRAHAGPVMLHRPVFHDMSQQVEILFHIVKIRDSSQNPKYNP